MTKPQYKLQPCDSTQISEHGFCPATNTLALRFKSKSGKGSLYHYPNVTVEKYAEFMAAESKGKFFGSQIKSNPAHPHTKIDETEGA